MTTECNQEPFPFHPLNQREVRGQFDGGSITSDAGGLLLREVEKRTNIIGQFASCFTDYRDPELKEHAVAELVAQRIYGLALGYEDLNDHEELRRDPLLGVLVEKEDLTGKDRRRVRDQGTALNFASQKLDLSKLRHDTFLDFYLCEFGILTRSLPPILSHWR